VSINTISLNDPLHGAIRQIDEGIIYKGLNLTIHIYT